MIPASSVSQFFLQFSVYEVLSAAPILVWSWAFYTKKHQPPPKISMFQGITASLLFNTGWYLTLELLPNWKALLIASIPYRNTRSDIGKQVVLELLLPYSLWNDCLITQNWKTIEYIPETDPEQPIPKYFLPEHFWTHPLPRKCRLLRYWPPWTSVITHDNRSNKSWINVVGLLQQITTEHSYLLSYICVFSF